MHCHKNLTEIEKRTYEGAQNGRSLNKWKMKISKWESPLVESSDKSTVYVQYCNEAREILYEPYG